MPVLEQGTWKMGGGKREAKEEVAALRLGNWSHFGTKSLFRNEAAAVVEDEHLA